MAAVEGVLNVNKPGGMTSHDVINQIRRLSGTRRVGHAGTLDPLATGVLLVCLGRATRLVEYLVGRDKTYEATVRLGQTTNTYDADGEVVAERPYSHVTRAQLQQTLAQFCGPIRQRPPMYSAVKRDGRPLYKLARQGIEIDVPPRDVIIFELALLEWSPPEARLRLVCSSGTYVRSLAHDLGQALECGGHVTALCRTAVGDFSLSEAVTLADLNEINWRDHLLASDTAVAHLPRLDLSVAQAGQLRQGQRPLRQTGQPPVPLARAYDPAGQFIGIITSLEEYLQARKIFHPATSNE